MTWTKESRTAAAQVRSNYAERIDTAPWEPWMDDPSRACVGAPTDEFFRYGGVARKAIWDYCTRCPVMVQCGEWALRVPSLAGVWGGMTTTDRSVLRNKRMRQGGAD